MQKRSEILSVLEDAIAEDPQLGPLICAALNGRAIPDDGTSSNPSAAKRGRGRPKSEDGSNAKLGEVLKGGDWIGTPAVISATGWNKSKVLAALRGTDRIESRTDPEHAKRLQWRLKP
ncbi:MAG: hypothetical protein IT438_02990 [Phycisphaerales bacterium]|nr:hypothetical protein [Phycisphaerales bacterium]